MEKILISACLVGDKTKYDGKSNYTPLVKELLKNYELVPFCGEVEGGLTIPRKPSERKKDKVVSEDGKDVTFQYKKGTDLAINICLYLGIKIAILKEKSPCCGVHEIYDGTFTHHTIEGKGTLTEALEKKGIKVYNELEIPELLKEENGEE